MSGRFSHPEQKKGDEKQVTGESAGGRGGESMNILYCKPRIGREYLHEVNAYPGREIVIFSGTGYNTGDLYGLNPFLHGFGSFSI